MTKTYQPKTNRKNKSHKLQAAPDKFKAGFLAALDGRTDLAKALRASYDQIVADVGGWEDVSRVKAALVERFVWLEAILQTIEQEMAQGKIDKGEALGRWIQAVNALSGLAKVLGVERHAKAAPWLVIVPEQAPQALQALPAPPPESPVAGEGDSKP